jgi:hypothetical protein
MNTRDPHNPVLFDRYNERYDEAVNDAIAFFKLKVDFFVHVKAAYMRDVLAEHFGDPSGVDLLDVGCGIGHYHPYWIDQVGSLRGGCSRFILLPPAFNKLLRRVDGLFSKLPLGAQYFTCGIVRPAA